MARLRPGATYRLDYAAAAGPLRVVVLDLVRRDAGSGGVVTPATLAFLRRALREAGDHPVLVAVHQPLDQAEGGASVFDVLDADLRAPSRCWRVTRHRNAIVAAAHAGRRLLAHHHGVDRRLAAAAADSAPGGHAGGGLARETGTVHHTRPGPTTRAIWRALPRTWPSSIPRGAVPPRAAGPPSARNARLHLPARTLRARARPGRPRPLPPPRAEVTLGAGPTV